jgi:hypothetical protein
MKKIFILLATLALFSIAAYTGPGNRTGITTNVIWRTTCWSTQYPPAPPVWRYRSGPTWDNVYALPGSPEALFWQANYPEAPDGTSCYNGLEGKHGWGYGTLTLGSFDPVNTAHNLVCAMPGDLGWCRGGLTLALWAGEPIPNQVVRYFETASGILCDPADAASVTCSTPITTEGVQSASFWAVSSFGDTSLAVPYSWKLDATAPANISSSPAPSGANGWYVANVDLSLSGTDATSGIDPDRFRYQIAPGPWNNGTLAAITADGVHTVNTEAYDIAGNIATRTVTIRLDKTPPTVSPVITGTLQNGWYNTPVTNEANAADVTSGIASVERQVDGGAWYPGDQVIVTSDGTHQVSFRATDNAGHVTLGSTVTYSIDRTPPTLIPSLPAPGGANGWHTADVTGNLSAYDALSGLAPGSLRYWIDGGTWVFASSLNITTDGMHAIGARAEDRAGNIHDISFNVPIDKTAPTLSVSAPGGWLNASGTVSVLASDATSGLAGVAYRIEGGAWQAGDQSTLTTEGIHNIEFRATDNAGHVTTRATTLRVDQTAPIVNTSLPTPDGLNGWYVSNPNIPLSALDALSGIAPGSLEYRFNSLDWTAGNSVTVSQDGTHIIEARANDLAGNTGSTGFEVRVDTVAPELEINVTSDMPMQNGWYVSPATATAFATDATSGLSKVEYQIETAMAQRAGRFKRVSPSWVNGSSLTLEDGIHNLSMRATDSAGNQTESMRTIKVDSLAPFSTFAPISGPISGTVSLSGSTADAVSGIAKIEYSLDGGLTWQTTSHTNGNWMISYNTTQRPDGQYTILVRATDQAGHIESPVSLVVAVNNAPPKVSLSEWWWIWESGRLSVQPGVTALGSVHLQIGCGNLPDVVIKFDSPDNLPSDFTWNRRCGDGTLAESGEYTVTLTACNIYGKCASAKGMIRIPEGQVTETPFPTATPSQQPTPTRPASTPTAMPTQAIAWPPVPEPPPPAPIPLSWPLWLLPVSALFGAFLALGFNAASDPRPQAIRCLGSLLNRTADER